MHRKLNNSKELTTNLSRPAFGSTSVPHTKSYRPIPACRLRSPKVRKKAEPSEAWEPPESPVVQRRGINSARAQSPRSFRLGVPPLNISTDAVPQYHGTQHPTSYWAGLGWMPIVLETGLCHASRARSTPPFFIPTCKLKSDTNRQLFFPHGDARLLEGMKTRPRATC